MPSDVLYVEGPGDIVASFESWRAGREHASETSVTFSSQLFAHCRSHGLSLHAISYGPRAARVTADGFVVENLPRRMLRLPKIGYRLSLFWYACRIGLRVLKERPRLVLATSGVMGWSAFGALRWTGAEVVPILHNALWPEGFAPQHRLRGVGLWQSARAPVTLVVSPAIRRQLAAIHPLAGERAIEFRPSFAASEFPLPAAPQHAARPFRILFVGRLEIDKGVLDLVEIAAALEKAAPGAFRVDICGAGSQLDALEDAIRARGLSSIVRLWGRLDRAALVARYQSAHVCVVPTRSSFSEGFAQVVAEAILLQRPVVTSPVVPASEPYAGAIELVATDSVRGYVEALLALLRDAARYERLVAACADLRTSILGREHSFQAALDRLVVTDTAAEPACP